jgi:anti-sigma B factor antagonist
MNIPQPRIPSDGLMRLRVSGPVPSTEIVEVEGEIDLSNCAHLAGVLCERLQAGVPTVVVDLSGVRFLAVAGLRVLVGARRMAEENGAELTIAAGGSHAVQRMLALAHLGADVPAG